MKDLGVLRLSAEACGKIVATGATGGSGIPIHGPFVPVLIDWNPFTNAEQRWQCVEKLLEAGSVQMAVKGNHHRLRPHWLAGVEFPPEDIIIECPASEFPARALAELQRRKGES